MAIRVMDMFCGISAFRSAAEKIGGFEFVGYCECDPTAIAAYRTLYDTRGEYFCNDARAINTDELPDFDLLVGGFPCQDYPEKINYSSLRIFLITGEIFKIKDQQTGEKPHNYGRKSLHLNLIYGMM